MTGRTPHPHPGFDLSVRRTWILAAQARTIHALAELVHIERKPKPGTSVGHEINTSEQQTELFEPRAQAR